MTFFSHFCRSVTCSLNFAVIGSHVIQFSLLVGSFVECPLSDESEPRGVS